MVLPKGFIIDNKSKQKYILELEICLQAKPVLKVLGCIFLTPSGPSKHSKHRALFASDKPFFCFDEVAKMNKN